VRLLDDTYRSWEGIYIGGLSSADYVKGHKPRLDFLSRFDQQDGYKILLCHHPEYFARYIRTLSIDLTVSGHAHGGQWCLFGRGIYAPGQGLFPRYTHGVHHAGRLLVSRGVGDSTFIPRIGAPNEIIMIHLSRNPQKEGETSYSPL
jgi:predicted MPP superfamily phosphohydrolase